MYASWVEYDALHLTVNNEYGTWPPAHTTVHMAECGDNCVQGSLHPRARLSHEGVLTDMPSEEILTNFRLFNLEVEQYQVMSDIANKFNRQNQADIFNENTMELPARPEAYSGDSFTNTISTGGWGTMTTGMYDIKGGFARSGYKSWGANGQGEAIDKNVAFDTVDMDRYMIVSLLPAYLDQDDDINDQDRIEMEVGAYPFRDQVWEPMAIDKLDQMDVPNVYMQVGADNANVLAASSIVMAAASMFIF